MSFVARGEHLPEIAQRLPVGKMRSRVVAFTGSAGVGKSTLIGKLIDVIRSRHETVAVLACDPQSPLSGGALLGDRFRMASRPEDEGVYIRSLAAVSGRGAVAEVAVDFGKAALAVLVGRERAVVADGRTVEGVLVG